MNPQRKLVFHGVDYEVGERKMNRRVKKLVADLKSLGVKRLGADTPWNHTSMVANAGRQSTRYQMELYLQAARKGIRIVPLEGKPHEEALFYLQQAISNVVDGITKAHYEGVKPKAKKKRFPAPMLVCNQWAGRIGEIRAATTPQEPRERAFLKMADLVTTEIREADNPFVRLVSIGCALGGLRTRTMNSNAKRARISHVIAYRAYAINSADIGTADLAKGKPKKENEADQHSMARAFESQYQQNQELLDRLKTIAVEECG